MLCPACNGAGKVAHTTHIEDPCNVCKGTGEVNCDDLIKERAAEEELMSRYEHGQEVG